MLRTDQHLIDLPLDPVTSYKTRQGAGGHAILKVDHAPTSLVCCLPLYSQACLTWLFRHCVHRL